MSGDLSTICTDPDRSFEIPSGVSVEFKSSLDALCSLNYTIVTQEMLDLMGIPSTDLSEFVRTKVILYFSTSVTILTVT